MFRLLFCLIAWMSSFFTLAHGQAPNNAKYQLRHFTDEDGLPQNSIKSIVTDQKGFVWLATEFGLVRFDGANFHAFRGANSGLLTNRIMYILPSGIPGKPVAITGNHEAIWADEQTTIVPPSFLADNNFLKGHITIEKTYTTIGLPNLFLAKLLADEYCIPLNTSSFFLINKDSARLYNKGSLQYSHPVAGKNPLDFFEIGQQLYYWPGKGQPLQFSNDSVHTIKITGDLSDNKAYRDNKQTVKVYWNVSTRQLFFGTAFALYLVKQQPGGDLHTTKVLDGFDLTDHEIMSVCYDEATHRLFLGSFTQGLYIAKPHDFKMVQSSVKGDDLYYAQAVYDTDKVITPRGYVLGPSAPAKTLPAFKGLLLKDQYSMFIAADQTIWVKLYDRLHHLNKDGTTILHSWDMGQEITHIFEDKAGRVFIALRNAGLYVLQPGATAPELLLDGKWDVSYIQQQEDDIYWMGTGSGCYRFYLSKRQMDTVPGLKGKYIRSLYIRSPQEIWVTTYEEGFFLHDGKTLTKMPLDKNNYLRTAHCILEDTKGFFWITTNKGLFQANRNDLLQYADGKQPNIYYQYYEKSSGFNSNEFNGGCQPCGVKLPAGYFSFPSMDGLVWFRPDSVQADLPDHELFVDRVEVNLEVRSATDTMQLDDEARRIKFFITTPYYGNSNNLSIEYALLGNNLDSIWLPLEADKSITLSAPGSGTHQLVIRKLSGFGQNNYNYKTLTLVIPPLFYERTWFWLVIFVVCVILLWIYSAFRLRYIRNKNKLLEARIADRTKELEKTMLALKDSEHDLRRQTRIQERLITAMAHDIKSPLRFMADLARRMTGQLDKSGLEKEKESAEVLSEAGTRVYYYTENLLQYIRSQMKENRVVLKPVNLFQLVEEKVSIFQTIAAEQQTEIVNLLPQNLVINSHANLLGVILHNVIDNAVKVTIGGKVIIQAFPQGTQCILSVLDTGIGMRPAMLEWCNAAVGEDSTTEDKVPGHTGLGLHIVKDLLPLIDARLHVQSAPERGTDLCIIISNAL